MEGKKKTSSERMLDNIKKYIRSTLKDVGVYDRSLGYMIELTASDLLIYRRFRSVCLDDGTPLTYNETSREGDDRIKMNPVFAEFRRQSQVVCDDFDKLTMNVKSKKKKADADDNLTRLLNDFSNDDGDAAGDAAAVGIDYENEGKEVDDE